MTDTPVLRSLPPNPSLEWLRKEAKSQLRLMQQSGYATLSDAQFHVARSYGFSSWRMMTDEVKRTGAASLTRTLRAVRRRVLPPPAMAEDAVELEQVFYKSLSVAMVAVQLMGLWGCYIYLANTDRNGHSVTQPPPVWVDIQRGQ